MEQKSILIILEGFMKGKKVIYQNKTYIILHSYGNGNIEILEEKSKNYNEIKLVTIQEVQIITTKKNNGKNDSFHPLF